MDACVGLSSSTKDGVCCGFGSVMVLTACSSVAVVCWGPMFLRLVRLFLVVRDRVGKLTA